MSSLWLSCLYARSNLVLSTDWRKSLSLLAKWDNCSCLYSCFCVDKICDVFCVLGFSYWICQRLSAFVSLRIYYLDFFVSLIFYRCMFITLRYFFWWSLELETTFKMNLLVYMVSLRFSFLNFICLIQFVDTRTNFEKPVKKVNGQQNLRN